MLDIDFFKIINDTYGHEIGDNAIKAVAEVLKENIRESDIAIRYGGEEFVVLLYNCDEDFVTEVAQKIRINFSKINIPTGGIANIKKTLSIGISIYPNDTQDIKEAIRFADYALYKAKNSGRNSVFRFTKSMLELQNKSK